MILTLLRNIAAVITGLCIGGIANMLIGGLNLLFFPMPDGMTFSDMFDEEKLPAILAWLETLPQSAFILVLVAHLSQAFIGGCIAALISSKKYAVLVAMIVGALSLLGGVMNMMQVPSPVWLWIEMPLYLVAAWLAGKLVLRMSGACCYGKIIAS